MGCVGDWIPGLENMDVPAWIENCALALTCGGKKYQASYQRTFVTNHDEICAEVQRVLSWDVQGLTGCHVGDLEETPEAQLINYWGWLLPGGYSHQPNKESALQ